MNNKQKIKQIETAIREANPQLEAANTEKYSKGRDKIELNHLFETIKKKDKMFFSSKEFESDCLIPKQLNEFMCLLDTSKSISENLQENPELVEFLAEILIEKE